MTLMPEYDGILTLKVKKSITGKRVKNRSFFWPLAIIIVLEQFLRERCHYQ